MKAVFVVGAMIALLGSVSMAYASESSPLSWRQVMADTQRLTDQGMYDQALQSAKRTFYQDQRLSGVTEKRKLKRLILIGDLNEKQANLEAAARIYRSAIVLHAAAYGARHPNAPGLICSLADIYAAQGRSAAAEILYSKARKMLDTDGARIDPALARSMMGLASIYASRGEYLRAEELYRDAAQTYGLLTKYQPALKFDLQRALFLLGRCAAQRNDYAMASAAYREALQYSDNSVKDLFFASQIWQALGDSYAAWQKPARSKYAYRQACRMLKAYGGDQETTKNILIAFSGSRRP
jgi:tetratricopeptide (TPR) repeat protein